MRDGVEPNSVLRTLLSCSGATGCLRINRDGCQWVCVCVCVLTDGRWSCDPCRCLIIHIWWMALIKSYEGWCSHHLSLPLFPLYRFFFYLSHTQVGIPILHSPLFFQCRMHGTWVVQNRWVQLSTLIKDTHKSSGVRQGRRRWRGGRWVTPKEENWGKIGR